MISVSEFAPTNFVGTAQYAEVWLAELPEEKKQQIVGSMSPGSRVALAMLRSAFAEESGMELPAE